MADTVEFPDCTCRIDTDHALLVRFPDMDDAVWIPKSQVDDDSEVYKKGTSGTLVITEWIATEKGLI